MSNTPTTRRSKWSNTLRSVDKLQSLLKCGLCQDQLSQPYVVGSCEHMFCKDCISPFLGKFCPECKLPADAKDMQHDLVMTDIVSKTSQLNRALGRYSLRNKGGASPIKSESPPVTPPRSPLFNGGKNKSIKGSPQKELDDSLVAPLVRRRGRPPASHSKDRVALSRAVSPNSKYSVSKMAVNLKSPTKDASPKKLSSLSRLSSPISDRVGRKRKGGSLSRGFSFGKGDKRPAVTPNPMQNTSPVVSNFNPKRIGKADPVRSVPLLSSTLPPPPPAGYTLKKNSKGETPLHLATIKGEISVVQDLLDQGANPNVKDNAGWTPLHEACHHGHLSLVELLINRGALVNLPGFENETALHDAVAMNHHAIAAILVGRGANKQARNSRGLTPMDLAINCSSEMKKALKTPLTLNSDSKEILANQQPQAFVQTSVVLLGTGLDMQQQEDLVRCAEILKGKVVTEFSHQVSHLVTVCDEEGRCQRTLKFLLAILRGKWILNFTWVEECIAFNRRVFEEPFEIVGAKQHAIMYGPKQARANGVNQFPPLFDGCSFYLDGNFVTPSPSKDNLAMLIRSGGGTVLTRDPRRHILNAETKVIPYHAPPNGSLSNVHYFVVSQNGPAEIKNSVCCISSAWLLACISTFRLLPHSFEEK